MRIAHIADLHIGKRLSGYDLREDQNYIFDQMIEKMNEADVEAVLISGDIYDSSTPSAEAVGMFSELLNKLAAMDKEICIIPGNHDSAGRLSFAAGLLNQLKIHIAGPYAGHVEKVVLNDAYGPVNFYLLPFIKPSMIRGFFDEPAKDYTDAVMKVLEREDIRKDERNVILAHQFITVGGFYEEHDLSQGGLNNVESFVFDNFEYVALGHIHKPSKAGRETCRYSGSPMVYSVNDDKYGSSFVVVDLKEKGTEPEVQTVPLKPLRRVCKIKGTFDELTDGDTLTGTKMDDYVQIVLTDTEAIPNVMERLRVGYPHILGLELNGIYQEAAGTSQAADRSKSPLELAREFFLKQSGAEANECQMEYLSRLIADICDTDEEEEA